MARPRERANDVAILDATERLLGRRGYEAMTVEQIAASAGVSKPTIYLRYRSKREVVGAMIDRLRPPLPGLPPARWSTTSSRYRDATGVGRPARSIVAAVLLEQDDHPELMERFQERVVQPSRIAFAAVLKAGVERGEVPAGTDGPELIDALIGAYWARAWSPEGFTDDWSLRLVGSILTLVARR